MSSNDTKYNGWTNYATWRINLEICDDLCASLVDEQTFVSASDLADYLRDTTEELVRGEDYDERNAATQYAMAFISDVNFYEIAEHNEELIAGEDGEPSECFECGAPFDGSHDPDEHGDRCPGCAQS